MAPGTRTPNGRTVPDKLAGWPRDLNTRLAAKTVARMGAVFSLQATTKTSPKHQTNEHRSKAFNAALCGKFEAQRKICPTAAPRYASLPAYLTSRLFEQ
jgi:hypothetical protein